ncbi:MAG: hypothetical protein PVJ73_10420 [Acidobacteriota bacterium]|jgi:hypothetical protein
MAPLLGLLIAGDVGLLPSGAVRSGSLLSSSVTTFLQEAILKRGEEVLFYSAGPLSYSDDGCLLTDQRIVSYWTDPEATELHVESATFSSIRRITVEYGSRSNATLVTVTKRNGMEFVLELPTAQGGDRLLVDELRKRLPFGTAVIAK